MKGEWLFRSEGNNLLRCDCKIVIVKRFCDPSIGWSMLFSFMSLHSFSNLLNIIHGITVHIFSIRILFFREFYNYKCDENKEIEKKSIRDIIHKIS